MMSGPWHSLQGAHLLQELVGQHLLVVELFFKFPKLVEPNSAHLQEVILGRKDLVHLNSVLSKDVDYLVHKLFCALGS